MTMLKFLQDTLENGNIQAFLMMVRHCEGTASDNGYRMLFGGKLIETFTDHPHVLTPYTNKAGEHIKTSAAGAYQITDTTWKVVKERLGLTDFSPANQDAAALELIRETTAIKYIIQGKLKEGINQVKHIWASLPGSGNNQPEHTYQECAGWFEAAGGYLTDPK